MEGCIEVQHYKAAEALREIDRVFSITVSEVTTAMYEIPDRGVEARLKLIYLT